MFKISVEPRAPLTHGGFHGAGESNHELNTEFMDFHLNMACRDGIFNNDTVSKQYSSMVAAPIWSRFGSIFLVQKFHIFGLCSRSCQSFSISFCPVPQKYMRIQILKARASGKFLVKSLR